MSRSILFYNIQMKEMKVSHQIGNGKIFFFIFLFFSKTQAGKSFLAYVSVPFLLEVRRKSPPENFTCCLQTPYYDDCY